MTKGALAMVVATEHPISEGVGGHKKKSSVAEHFPMIKPGRLSEARTVIAFAPELVDQVIAGGKSLDSAYEIAVDRKNGATQYPEADGVGGKGRGKKSSATEHFPSSALATCCRKASRRTTSSGRAADITASSSESERRMGNMDEGPPIVRSWLR